MLLKKSSSWFLTSTGRKVALAGVFSTGMGLTLINYLPNTFLIDKYREIVQFYRHGLPVPVSEKTLKLFNDVMDDMKIHPRIKELIKPFTVYGFDMFHAGSTLTRQGAVVGMPFYFHCSSTDQIEKSNITILNKSVPWSSKDGQQFLEALILSESAKKFAMGHQIAYVQTPYVYLNSVYPVSCVCLVYGIAHNVNKRFDLYCRPTSVRGMFYALVSLFGFGLWALLKDSTTVYFDKKCDKEISALSESYLKGGIEFYSKLLQRNVALRGLMGTKGETLYSVTGNEQYFLRTKSLPLVYRKLRLEEHLKEVDSARSVVE